MKLKDLLSKIVDSYKTIQIDVCKGMEQSKEFIYPHKTACTTIPEDILNATVDMIIPYYDRLSIVVSVQA